MLPETVSLDCPYCKITITRPLAWFQQPYSTCPGCAGGLSAAQFAPLVAELEDAFDASIDEMVAGRPGHGCSDDSSSCCGGGCR